MGRVGDDHQGRLHLRRVPGQPGRQRHRRGRVVARGRRRRAVQRRVPDRERHGRPGRVVPAVLGGAGAGVREVRRLGVLVLEVQLDRRRRRVAVVLPVRRRGWRHPWGRGERGEHQPLLAGHLFLAACLASAAEKGYHSLNTVMPGLFFIRLLSATLVYLIYITYANTFVKPSYN